MWLGKTPIHPALSFRGRRLGLCGVERAGRDGVAFSGGQRAAFATDFAVHCLSCIGAGSVLAVDVNAWGGCLRGF